MSSLSRIFGLVFAICAASAASASTVTFITPVGFTMEMSDFSSSGTGHTNYNVQLLNAPYSIFLGATAAELTGSATAKVTVTFSFQITVSPQTSAPSASGTALIGVDEYAYASTAQLRGTAMAASVADAVSAAGSGTQTNQPSLGKAYSIDGSSLSFQRQPDGSWATPVVVVHSATVSADASVTVTGKSSTAATGTATLNPKGIVSNSMVVN
jgi:hypothetical protein